SNAHELPRGPPTTRPNQSFLRLIRDRGQLEHQQLRSRLWIGNNQTPAEIADAFEDARHVALPIIAIVANLFLIAEAQAAQENKPVGAIVFPHATGRTLAAGQLDDGECLSVYADVAEKWLEFLERR